MAKPQPTREITFSNGAKIQCYSAITKKGRTEGLRAYPDLGGTQGLLMQFENDCNPYFWNRGVAFPVDIAFIGSADMAIHSILNLEPESIDIVTAPLPSKYIVEVRRGTFQELDLQVGMTINISKI